MSWKKIALGLVFLDFAAFTAYVVATEGFASLIDAHGGNLWNVQVFLDLCIAAGFGVRWMWGDAKRRGVNPLPWALAVLPTGSLALLAYALFRPSEARERGVAAATA